jgi:hypothetical protein
VDRAFSKRVKSSGGAGWGGIFFVTRGWVKDFGEIPKKKNKSFLLTFLVK